MSLLIECDLKTLSVYSYFNYPTLNYLVMTEMENGKTKKYHKRIGVYPSKKESTEEAFHS